MTTNVKVTMNLSGEETLSEATAPGASNAAGRKLKSDGLGVSKLLNATSTPAITAGPVIWDVTMAGTTQSLDLTAAPLQGGRTLDATGKKVVLAKILADKGNSGNVTVAAHDTNGYDLFGNTTTGVVFAPGRHEMFAFTDIASPLDAVASGKKIIELTGAATRKIRIELYFS